MKINAEPLEPKVILGVVAHPDDLDFGASGTIAKFVGKGASVYYLILTDGSKGTEDRSLKPSELTQIRRREQKAAGEILGLKDVFFLNYVDGELENSLSLKRDIVRHIRQVKPDVVITMDPAMLYSADRGFINHPDHRAAGQATLDAVFPLARDHLAFPELLQEGLEPHKTNTLLLISFLQHNYGMDITDTMPKKIKALAAHASQIADPDLTNGVITRWAEEAGGQHGCKYAETFVRIDIS